MVVQKIFFSGTTVRKYIGRAILPHTHTYTSAWNGYSFEHDRFWYLCLCVFLYVMILKILFSINFVCLCRLSSSFEKKINFQSRNDWKKLLKMMMMKKKLKYLVNLDIIRYSIWFFFNIQTTQLNFTIHWKDIGQTEKKDNGGKKKWSGNGSINDGFDRNFFFFVRTLILFWIANFFFFC